MRILQWICDNARKDRIKNDDIRERLGVAPIEEKLVQHHLRWFGHIQRRPVEAPVRSGVIRRTGNESQGTIKLDMRGVCEERFDELVYHKRASNR
jgi:hypothetical protein